MKNVKPTALNKFKTKNFVDEIHAERKFNNSGHNLE